jgi:hypothetical protein
MIRRASQLSFLVSLTLQASASRDRTTTNRIVVPKPVLDILAEMIAADSDLNVGSFGGGPGSDRGLD